MSLRFAFFILVLSLVWGGGMLVCSPHAYAEELDLFGTKEVFSPNMQPFPKWTGVLAKDGRHRQTMSQLCSMSRGDTCPMQQWQALVDSVRADSDKTKLDKVNQRLNQTAYVTDIVNWAINDYWETPYEFFSRDGDCEDYAIVKYMTLKWLGFPLDAMRVVVLQDRNLNLMHSVLVVHVSGTNYILDNQISQVVRDRDVHHYTPIYSINEQGWWRHLPR